MRILREAPSQRLIRRMFVVHQCFLPFYIYTDDSRNYREEQTSLLPSGNQQICQLTHFQVPSLAHLRETHTNLNLNSLSRPHLFLTLLTQRRTCRMMLSQLQAQKLIKSMTQCYDFSFLCHRSCVTHHIPDMFPCVTPLDSMTHSLVSRYAYRPMTTSCYNVTSIFIL